MNMLTKVTNGIYYALQPITINWIDGVEVEERRYWGAQALQFVSQEKEKMEKMLKALNIDEKIAENNGEFHTNIIVLTGEESPDDGFEPSQ